MNSFWNIRVIHFQRCVLTPLDRFFRAALSNNGRGESMGLVTPVDTITKVLINRFGSQAALPAKYMASFALPGPDRARWSQIEFFSLQAHLFA